MSGVGDDEDGGQEAKIAGEAEKEEEDREIMRKPKVARVPRAPTAREIAEHLPLHAEYRD